jgi:hypothetical protein
MRVWDDQRPSARRFRGSIGLALLLHLAFWFAPTSERSGTAFGATFADDVDSIQVSLDAAEPEPKAPGGGSPSPDPKAIEPAARNVAPVKPVARVTTPPSSPAESVDSDEALEADTLSGFDLLATLDAPSTALAKSGPRKVLIEARSTVTAARGADLEERSDARSFGSGSGAHGGPGGHGTGNGTGGVVTRAFAFGGPTGAFRAEVCAIRVGVKSVKEVTSCPPLATFFTNVLDVSPRGFSEGFPGVTARTEWFAIRYRGKFTVKAGDYYRFRLVSDDGAILYIDGYPVVDNDGQHPPVSKQATIQLEAGEHELFVMYYQGPRDNLALQLFVKGSEGPERLLGPSI